MLQSKREAVYTIQHQYIDRATGRVCTEPLYHDALVNFLYSNLWERMPLLYKLLTSAWASRLLGFVNYDTPLGAKLLRNDRFLRACQVDLSECLEKPEQLVTARKIFERKIRYWECRPLPGDPRTVVSPADARVLVGSLRETSGLFLKWKFFDFAELLGRDKYTWVRAFTAGDFVIGRLTPDKYHYNHMPVAGVVLDFYEIPGGHHSCNPGAVVSVVTPYSKNKRVVTIIDTDGPGGSQVGLVAMIEIVALMIGNIVQCYSEERYAHPQSVTKGMYLRKGCPKSLYRPGSSTTVLLFQRERVEFADDLVQNRFCHHAQSRFSVGFGRPLVETDIKVRSVLASAVQQQSAAKFPKLRAVLSAAARQRFAS